MTILEHQPAPDEILPFIDDSIRQLKEGGADARFIVVGPDAYRLLRKAIGQRFQRGAGQFETYNYLPIVVDPGRGGSVCVLPAPAVTAQEARLYRMEG